MLFVECWMTSSVFSFQRCYFWKNIFCHPRTNNLRVYFQTLCPHGRFHHEAYLEEHNTWHHQPTNIRVWQDVIDLTEGRGGQIYFHYINEVSFQQITSLLESMEHVEVLDTWEDVFLSDFFVGLFLVGLKVLLLFNLLFALLNGSTGSTYVYIDWRYCCSSNMSHTPEFMWNIPGFLEISHGWYWNLGCIVASRWMARSTAVVEHLPWQRSGRCCRWQCWMCTKRNSGFVEWFGLVSLFSIVFVISSIYVVSYCLSIYLWWSI